MKKLFLLSVLYLLTAVIIALPISQQTAASIAGDWMRQISSNNSIQSIIPITNPESTELVDWFTVSFTNGGFILISADDRVSPILGYSTTAGIEISNLPLNLSWFLNEYHAEISAIRNTPLMNTHPGWQALSTGDFSAYLPNRPVTPLLTTNWDQGWPYNSLCPTDAQGPGGRVYAGCGATTMGQIMKFWAHPTQGTGSYSYTHSTYGVISANFGATTYNYSSMPNSLYWTPNTNISTLLFHCGVALNMDYGPNGSGSYMNAVRPAMINYFNYETTMQTVYKNSYTQTNWEATLRTELDAGRPIYYIGVDTSYGGHAFVCDGYQGTNYFHFNWGWSGSFNGYFYVSNLNPGSYQFNTNQGAVIGIRPAAPVTAPTNLTATVDAGNLIFLEWQNPLNRALLGYKVYKNGVLYANVEDPLSTYFFDINQPAGTYTYYVTAVFTQGESDPSNTATATIYPAPVINYQDSFELFSDFSTSLSPWFSYDLDQAPTMEFDDTDFPGEGSPMSFIVFNPSATVPPMTDIDAQNGQKLIACLPAIGTANNDWFCSPKWNTGNIARLRFWAKSALTDNGLAKIKVGVGTSSPEPSNMTIISGAEPIEVPAEWTVYNFTLSNNLFSNVFVGVNCISDNGSMLLLDRFQLWSSYLDNEDANIVPSFDLNLSISPNPFSSRAEITWQQKTTEKVSISIYDIKGRHIRTLLNDTRTAGNQALKWDGKDNQGKSVANGIYYCQVQMQSGSSTVRKLALLK